MVEEEKIATPKPIEIDALDWIAFAGLVALIAGIAWIYEPAALIVLGMILIFYAFVSSRPPAPAAKPKPRDTDD